MTSVAFNRPATATASHICIKATNATKTQDKKLELDKQTKRTGNQRPLSYHMRNSQEKKITNAY